MSSFLERLREKRPIDYAELRKEASDAKLAEYEMEERAAKKAELIVKDAREKREICTTVVNSLFEQSIKPLAEPFTFVKDSFLPLPRYSPEPNGANTPLGSAQLKEQAREIANKVNGAVSSYWH